MLDIFLVFDSCRGAMRSVLIPAFAAGSAAFGPRRGARADFECRGVLPPDARAASPRPRSGAGAGPVDQAESANPGARSRRAWGGDQEEVRNNDARRANAVRRGDDGLRSAQPTLRLLRLHFHASSIGEGSQQVALRQRLGGPSSIAGRGRRGNSRPIGFHRVGEGHDGGLGFSVSPRPADVHLRR